MFHIIPLTKLKCDYEKITRNNNEDFFFLIILVTEEWKQLLMLIFEDHFVFGYLVKIHFSMKILISSQILINYLNKIVYCKIFAGCVKFSIIKILYYVL